MSSFYTVEKYADMLWSYFNKIVPLTNHERNIKFRNKVAVNSPELHGVFKRLAALLVNDINYETLPADKMNIFKEGLPPILKKCKYKIKMYEIFYNLFIYDFIVATIYPKTTFKITCRKCKAEQSVNENFKYDFRLSPDSVKKDKIQMFVFCPECDSEQAHDIEEVSHTGNLKKNPLNILMFNPLDVVVSEGYGGATRVYFSTDKYQTRLFRNGIRPGMNMSAEQIVNLPLKIVESIILNRPLRLNTNITQVFKHPKIAGLRRGLSPMMLSLTMLLHTNILRKGREAEALLKIDPQYIVTPIGGASSPSISLTDGRAVTEFIMKSVKKVKEGDSNGLVYSPTPVQAIPIMPEGKRWITSQEILNEEATLINSTGFDASVLQGGAGIINDPFLLHTAQEILGFYTDQSEEFVNKLVSQISIYHPKFDIEDYIELKDVTQSDGTALDQVALNLIGTGELPKSMLTRKYGYDTLEVLLKQLKEEQILTARYKMETDIAVKEEETRLAPMVMAKGAIDPGMMKQIENEIIMQAESIAQELSQMDEGTKKSNLDKIQKQSYALYATVIAKLRDINQMQTQDAKQMAKEQSQGSTGQ